MTPVFPLGTRVIDVVNGYSGVVVGRAEYLHGISQCLVEREALRDGLPIAPQWIAVTRLRELEQRSKLGAYA